tara:strand:- start:1173 stop:1706 length:534 start_codon:yes stop_codon:yes gene_type:complete
MSQRNQVLIFDIEATGLLRQSSKIHCLVVRDLANPDDTIVFDHRDTSTIDMGIELLRRSSALIGHNIIGYDIPLIRENYEFDYEGVVVDTLVMSRLFYTTLMDKDYEKRPSGMPQRLYGSHGLEAWGYRTKVLKGDYGKQADAWDKYTPEMLDYCKQDTLVTLKVYELMMRRMEEYA